MKFTLETQGWIDIGKSIYANHYINNLKKKPHISWYRKALDKIQYIITFLNPRKLGIQGNFLNLTKDIYKNPTASIILNGERLNYFPLRLGRRRTNFKMVEEWDVEITFLPINTSKIHLHMEQLLQNTYWMLAEDLRLPIR